MIHDRNSRIGTFCNQARHIRPQAPTASIVGKNPSFRLSSNLLISSTDVAAAIAAFTLVCSSFDISRPACPAGVAFAFAALCALGSSAVAVEVMAAREAEEDMLSAILSARAFGRPSAVVNSVLACCLSYIMCGVGN
jgi:hypothetical protein